MIEQLDFLNHERPLEQDAGALRHLLAQHDWLTRDECAAALTWDSAATSLCRTTKLTHHGYEGNDLQRIVRNVKITLATQAAWVILTP